MLHAGAPHALLGIANFEAKREAGRDDPYFDLPLEIAQTQAGMLTLTKEYCVEDGTLMMFGDTVKPLAGRSGAEHAQLQRDFTRIEILDYLTGQEDRHGLNFIVELGDDGAAVGVKGIDNDVAFGTKDVDPVGMPSFIDEAAAKSIASHDRAEVFALLSQHLKPAEVEKAVGRFDALKAEIVSGALVPVPDAAWGAEMWAKANGAKGSQNYLRTKMKGSFGFD